MKKFEEGRLYNLTTTNTGFFNNVIMEGDSLNDLIETTKKRKDISVIYITESPYYPLKKRSRSRSPSITNDSATEDDSSDIEEMNRPKLIIKRKKTKLLITVDDYLKMSPDERHQLSKKESIDFIVAFIKKTLLYPTYMPIGLYNGGYRTCKSLIGGVVGVYFKKSYVSKMKGLSAIIYDRLTDKERELFFSLYRTQRDKMDSNIHVVSRVCHYNKQTKRYLIQWNNGKSSWEPEEDMEEDIPKMLEEFHKNGRISPVPIDKLLNKE